MDSEIKKNGDDQMTAEERKVYDRQIRLWGHDGQNKIRAAKILLIGMQGLGAEIAKNLILSGIHSITLKDHTDVSILDRCSQFLIPHDSKECNRAKASLSAAQKLNSNVKVTADTTPIEKNDHSFISSYNIVIATECSQQTYKKLSEDCRKVKVKLFIADVYGLFGYFFQDVHFNHSLYDGIFPIEQKDFNVPKTKDMLPFYLTKALLKFQCNFNRRPNPDTCEKDIEELKTIIGSLDLGNLNVDAFEEYYNELFCELSPTTSIIGAMVAQTASNTIMDNAIKKYNVFFYDHIEHEGKFHLL